jgi:hypothetical protein
MTTSVSRRQALKAFGVGAVAAGGALLLPDEAADASARTQARRLVKTRAIVNSNSDPSVILGAYSDEYPSNSDDYTNLSNLEGYLTSLAPAGTCRVPRQNRCPNSGRGSSLWSCKMLFPRMPCKPIIRGARRIPISRISDGVIEAGGCLDRRGLRSSSVVLVNQATQEVPTSDRVVDG